MTLEQVEVAAVRLEGGREEITHPRDHADDGIDHHIGRHARDDDFGNTPPEGLEQDDRTDSRGRGIAQAGDQAYDRVQAYAVLGPGNRDQVIQHPGEDTRQFIAISRAFLAGRENLYFYLLNFHASYMTRSGGSASGIARMISRFPPAKIPPRNAYVKGHLPLLATLSLTVFAGCASNTAQHTATQLNSTKYETLYLGANGQVVKKSTEAGKVQTGGYWKGDGVSGSPAVVINLTNQEAYFYKGGALVGMSPISSGREGYRTPSGSFSIIQKNADHRSNLYGNYVDASGNVVVRNVGVLRDPKPPGTRFAGAPMPYFMRITGAVGMHAGYLPGVPDSHGCIRMPNEMARTFFDNVSYGTPVRVTH